MLLALLFFGMFLVESAIKHPQAPQQKWSFYGIFVRSAVAGLRQSNSHARPGMERSLAKWKEGIAACNGGENMKVSLWRSLI